MATANLFSGGCLLCMPFGSKLLELHVETSWLHFVAVVNFIIIADKFRKKKTTASNVPIVAIDVTTSLSLTGNRDWVLCIEYEVFI